VALAARTAAICSLFTPTLQTPPQAKGFRVIQVRKRARSSGTTTVATPTRGPKRPRGISAAAQDPNQAKLFASGVTNSQQLRHQTQADIPMNTVKVESDRGQAEPMLC